MKLISVLTLGVAFAIQLHAQTDTAQAVNPTSFGVVDTVIVVGNDKTKESVILREMTLKPGTEATPEAIEFDRGRIYSIGLFTSVDISFVPFEGKNLLDLLPTDGRLTLSVETQEVGETAPSARASLRTSITIPAGKAAIFKLGGGEGVTRLLIVRMETK